MLPVVNDLLAAHPGLSVRLVLSDRFAHLVDEGVDVAEGSTITAPASRRS